MKCLEIPHYAYTQRYGKLKRTATKQLKIIMKTKYFTIIIFLFFLDSAYSQTIQENINELMTEYSKNGKFNGSILVKKGNQIIYENAFGLANREWRNNFV